MLHIFWVTRVQGTPTGYTVLKWKQSNMRHCLKPCSPEPAILHLFLSQLTSRHILALKTVTFRGDSPGYLPPKKAGRDTGLGDIDPPTFPATPSISCTVKWNTLLCEMFYTNTSLYYTILYFNKLTYIAFVMSVISWRQYISFVSQKHRKFLLFNFYPALFLTKLYRVMRKCRLIHIWCSLV